MEDVIVYTANIGNYDKVQTPKFKKRGVRYILFTDDINLKSNFWEIIICSQSNNNTKTARYFKINPHSVLPEHKISIWVDSSFNIDSFYLDSLIQELGEDNIACFKHGSRTEQRNCLYEESKICLSRNLDNQNLIQKQILKYLIAKFPHNYGLFATGLIIRKNNLTTSLFNSLWWNEILDGSIRDQLSQMYVSWKLNTPIKPLNWGGESIYNNQYLIKFKHKKGRNDL